MPSRDDIVAEARTWLGTPWQHQGRLKGVGTDCAGVVLGVGVAVGAVSSKDAQVTGYGRQPDPVKMKGALDFLFDRVPKSDMKAGDIPWLRAQDKAQHLGIVTERRTLIHAVNYQVVQELPIESLVKQKIMAVYRYRGLDG